MLNHIFLKFALFFVGGAILMFGVTQILPSILTNKQSSISSSKSTAYYSQNSGQVLGVENELGNEITRQATSQLQNLTQSLLDNILYIVTKSPAFAPITETTQGVQDTVTEVQGLPQAQKNAICKELCGGF